MFVKAFSLVALYMFVVGSQAFFMGVPLRTPVRQSSAMSPMSMKTPTDHPEIEEAEAKALEATKKFGAQSDEARLAWDAYEEIAAADNSIATRKSLDEDCDVENSAICEEYEAQMKELEEILAKGPALDSITKEQLAMQNKKLIEENSRLKSSLGTYK